MEISEVNVEAHIFKLEVLSLSILFFHKSWNRCIGSNVYDASEKHKLSCASRLQRSRLPRHVIKVALFDGKITDLSRHLSEPERHGERGLPHNYGSPFLIGELAETLPKHASTYKHAELSSIHNL